MPAVCVNNSENDELWSGNMAYSVTRDIDIRQVVERSPFV